MSVTSTRPRGRRTDPRRRLDARARRIDLRRARRLQARGDIPMAFWVLIAVVAILSVLGLIAVFSVTTVRGHYKLDSATYFFKRQGFFLMAGVVAMFAVYKIGYRRVAALSRAAMMSSVALLALVLVAGNEVNGSTRWFEIGWLNFQPSELAKLAVIVWVAKLLSVREREMHDPQQTILPVCIGLGVTSLLILLEPDLGTVIVLGIVVFTMLVVAGARLDWLFGVSVPALLVVGILSQTGYHADRWGFMNPLENADSTNYQLLGSLSSVASGGWFGVGPGGSSAKWGYLPEAHTDAIFAVVAEEMGIVGALSVILLYLVILGCGIHVARYAAERFGQLLAIGITTLISVQAFVNIGVVLGVLPNKGFTLPFVSYGGSSMVMCMGAIGLLLSVAREGDEQQARLRRRQSANRRLAQRAPSRGGLVLVASEGKPTRRRPLRSPGRETARVAQGTRGARGAQGARAARGAPAASPVAKKATPTKRRALAPGSTGARSAGGRAGATRSTAARTTSADARRATPPQRRASNQRRADRAVGR